MKYEWRYFVICNDVDISHNIVAASESLENGIPLCCDFTVAINFSSPEELIEWVKENTNLKMENGDYHIEGHYLSVERLEKAVLDDDSMQIVFLDNEEPKFSFFKCGGYDLFITKEMAKDLKETLKDKTVTINWENYNLGDKYYSDNGENVYVCWSADHIFKILKFTTEKEYNDGITVMAKL